MKSQTNLLILNKTITMETKNIEIEKSDILKYGVPEDLALRIKAKFEPTIESLTAYESEFQAVMELWEDPKNIDKALCKRAWTVRKAIKKVRSEIEKMRKAEKDPYLKSGQAIDWITKRLKDTVSGKEMKLENIETYFEKIEAEKIAKLEAERIEELSKYKIDGSEMKLGKMAGSSYDKLLKEAKIKYQADKDMEEEKIKQEKIKALQIERERKFLKIGVDWTVYSLGEMTEGEFNTQYTIEETKYNKEQEKIKKQEEELEETKRQLKKESDERRKLEDEKRAKEKEKKDEETRKRAAQKDQAYKDFYVKNKDLYDGEIIENGKIILYKIVDELEI